MDCFVALLLAMTAGCTLLSRDLPRRRRRAREIGGQLRMARLGLLRGFFLHRAVAADAIRQRENFDGGIERQRRKHFEHVGDVLLISSDQLPLELPVAPVAKTADRRATQLPPLP